ncbi:MAG: type II secretion system protein [Bacilli bacterium]|nr:type II secretion system protein [Bacilli bacterium]
MKKGFTLVELLAVIVILGIIAVITVPRIQEALYELQDDAYDLLVTQIEESANDYVVNNNLASQVTVGNPLDIYLHQLIDAGYIKQEDLADPRSEGDYIDPVSSYVRFTLEAGDLEYKAYFTSITPVE